MKKFYKLVSTASVAGGFEIMLDGKAVKTPAGASLLVPTDALAHAIASEWAEQGEDILPDTMPLTQILTTAQEQVPREREAMTEKLLAYLDTDLLCYRAESPVDMGQSQCVYWDPWLNWFKAHYGMALKTTTGLQALNQPAAAREKSAHFIAALDDMHFTILQLAAVLTGSLVLALAFTAGAASAAQLYNAANVEENHKTEIYNEAEYGVAPAQDKAQKEMRRDLEAARRFLDLSEVSEPAF